MGAFVGSVGCCRWGVAAAHGVRVVCRGCFPGFGRWLSWWAFLAGVFWSWLYRRCSASSTLKYRHFRRFLAHPVKKGTGRSAALLLAPRACGLPPIGGPRSTLSRGPCRAGSLTGAVHLSNGNAGVPRRAQRGRKPRVEQKGKSSLDLDFQYEYGPRKRGPSILSERRALFRREVSEKLPQG